MTNGSAYMRTQRTIITVSDTDKKWLEAYSRSRGISMAEAIRRGISRLKAEEGRSTYEAILGRTRGLGLGSDGLEFQEKMRSEWDDRTC